MKIREMLKIEDYIKETIHVFSLKVKEAGDSMECNRTVVLSIDAARRIANCLDWLEDIVSSNIDNINIEEVNIRHTFKTNTNSLK